MIRTSRLAVSLAAFAGLLSPSAASAQDAVAKFYDGRSMDMIIGAAPGCVGRNGVVP